MRAKVIALFLSLLGLFLVIAHAPDIATPYIAASFVILALKRDEE